jgi:hypothetical protein
MAFETGMFVLALVAFLVRLPLTVLHIYALIYPKSDIGKKLYPRTPFTENSKEFQLLQRLIDVTEELANQRRTPPTNPPVPEYCTLSVRSFPNLATEAKLA